MIDVALENEARHVVEGDAHAEVRLVSRLAPAVRNIVRSALRTHDWAAIDDLSQDILWSVVQRLRRGGLEDLGRLDHFVCRMARNMAIDLWRERSREVSAEVEGSADDDPLALIERSDALRAARVMIGSMRVERDKRLLVGVYFDGASKEYLCRELGIESAHFDRVLFRARERLVSMLRATRRTDLEFGHG